MEIPIVVLLRPRSPHPGEISLGNKLINHGTAVLVLVLNLVLATAQLRILTLPRGAGSMSSISVGLSNKTLNKIIIFIAVPISK